MKYIYQAREKGAKVVVIDPLFSQTAAKADLYLRVRSGSDGALALGMARHLVDTGRVDQSSSIISRTGIRSLSSTCSTTSR